MKTVERRLDRLEDWLAPQGRKQFLIILTDARQSLALDSGKCVQILREAGHLDTTSLSCVVDLGYIPNGLDAAELEQYLYSREVTMRRINVLVLTLLTFPVSAAWPQALGEDKFTTFDVPGAGTGPGQGTIVNGINAGGAITGWYLDASNVKHGFLGLSDDTIITFDAPGAGTGPGQGTIALGMNSARAITGQFLDSSSASHGFLRSRDGTMTTFDAPGSGTGPGQGTQAANINPVGEISGRYTDASNVNHGFVRAPDGTITTFDAPGAGTGPGQGTFSIGNNPSGAITGYYVDGSNVNHGFLRN